MEEALTPTQCLHEWLECVACCRKFQLEGGDTLVECLEDSDFDEDDDVELE